MNIIFVVLHLRVSRTGPCTTRGAKSASRRASRPTTASRRPRSSPAPPASTNSGSSWRGADVVGATLGPSKPDLRLRALNPFIHCGGVGVVVFDGSLYPSLPVRQFRLWPLEGGGAPPLLPSFAVGFFFFFFPPVMFLKNFFFCFPLIPDSLLKLETLCTSSAPSLSHS